MNTNFKKVLAVAGISLIASGSSFATTSTTTFQVTALVASSCSFSAGVLDFGTYDPLAALPTDASSTISVTCNLSTPYTLKLNGGSVANDISARMMDAGAATDLGYQLYTSALRTTIWGNGTTGSTVTGAGLGPLLPVSHTVYGRVANGQNVPNGSYADTITASIDF